MSRQIWLAGLFTLAACSSCSKSAGNQDKDTVAPPTATDRIAVPGGIKGPTTGGAPTPTNDPRFELQADEGTLTIDKAEGKAGAELVAMIKVAPTAGRHLATDYPIKMTLEAPDGVKLTKAELTAGGRDKAQGDATTLSEQQLAFTIKATCDKAGAYEIKGTFKFGVCDSESCHPKKQPFKITVAAN